LAGFLSDGFLVGNDWVTLLKVALGILLNKIFKADLKMEFTTTGNNVFTRFLSVAEDEWVRLGEFLESLNKFWEIGGVLDIDGDSDDWGYRVFHDSDVVCIFSSGDSTLLEEILIDTNKSDGVTAWDIWDSLDFTSHHDDGSLDVLDVQIVLGSWEIVWSLDSDFLSGGDGTSEDSTESVESTFIVGWDHLGDEDTERSIFIAVINRFESFVSVWTFIKVSGSVLLGLNWGWQFKDDHFKKSFSGVDPLLEDVLHEMLSLKLSLLGLEGDFEVDEHLVDLLHFSVHGGSAESDDWLHHETNESSLEGSTIIGVSVVLPFLGFGIEEVVSPKFLHHLLSSDTEFLGVNLSEFGKGEGPSEKSRSHSGSTVHWVNLLGFSHIFALVGGDDDVNVLDNSLELIVHGLSINLELEDTSINLVDHEYWLNLFSECLSQHGLSLDGDTLNVIDDNEGTIGDSECSGDFGREIDVTW
jgi:hypothetical protein